MFEIGFDRYDSPQAHQGEESWNVEADTARAMLRDPEDPTLHDFLNVPDGGEVKFDYDPAHDEPGWREGIVVGPDGAEQTFHLRAQYPGRVAQAAARLVGMFGHAYEPPTTVHRRVIDR